jgi:UDP-glucose 4-epimerase
MRILITGGTGFIGRNLKEQLANRYKILAPRSSELDLLDEKRVYDFMRQYRCDVVLHTATWNATRTSPKDTAKVLQSNLRMFFNLTRCSDYYGKLVYYGSGAEYDRRFWLPRMNEDYFDTHVPVDDYGYSKYIMRKFAESSRNIYELCLFGVFGKYEDWQIRFISNACCRAAWDLPIRMRQNRVFDYLHVDDVVRLTQWFIEHDAEEKMYNLCSGEPIELSTLAQMVLAVSRKHVEIYIEREGLGSEYSGDNTKLLKTVGSYRFKDRINCMGELFDWYVNHKASIDPEKLILEG